MAANKKRNRNKKNRKDLLLLIGAAVFLCLAILIAVIPKGGAKKDTASNSNADRTAVNEVDRVDELKDNEKIENNSGNAGENLEDTAEVQVIGEGESLVISIGELSSTVKFYPVEVDGTQMEVLAVLDSDGNVRTAFNTCQICYGSGRGYYVQDGDMLVCQNCGNRFTIDQVEIESGGCNPWPIFAENKTVTEDEVFISYDFLLESKTIFANWKIAF